ncbi:MAG: flagellar hook-associated protein FlgK [Pseudomonadota bacterium]
MVGLTSALRTAVTGLHVTQEGLGVAANNVTNARTPGFTRKSLEQETISLDGAGMGVRSTGITRKVDNFLESQIRNQAGELGRSTTIDELMSRAQGLVFGDPSDDAAGLGRHVDTLVATLEAAAASPNKSAERTALVGAAADLFQALGDANGQIQALRRDADRRIGGLVDDANVAIQAIHDLNLEIARVPEAAELRDQRDRLVSQLSSQLDVSTHMLENDRLAIYAPNGQPLLEYAPRVLVYEPASTVMAGTVFQAVEIYAMDPATGGPDLTKGKTDLAPQGTLGLRGELGGFVQMRDGTLPGMASQIGEIGELARYALNDAHNRATPLPPPNGMTGTRTTFAPPPAAWSGTASIALVDLTTDATAATLSVDLTAPAFAAATTAADFAAALNGQLSPQVVASVTAEGAVALEAANANHGLAIDAGTAAIAAQDESGHDRNFGLAHYFGLNDLIVAHPTDSARSQVRADVVADPSKLASAKLDVDPALPGGSRLGGVGDNRGLQDLAAALDQAHATAKHGGLSAGTTSVRGYVAEVIGFQAVLAEQATAAVETDDALAAQLELHKATISGVNTDEEMAELMVLQQAYATSARLVSIVDGLMEELLAMKR